MPQYPTTDRPDVFEFLSKFIMDRIFGGDVEAVLDTLDNVRNRPSELERRKREAREIEYMADPLSDPAQRGPRRYTLREEERRRKGYPIEDLDINEGDYRPGYFREHIDTRRGPYRPEIHGPQPSREVGGYI